MTSRRRLAPALLLLLLALPAAAQPTPTTPCADSEAHRQFDFWVGTWDVYDAEGQRVGGNVIDVREGGCVLVEQWTSARGGTGMSMNYYDPGREAWVQHWMAPNGTLIRIAGGLREGSMVLEGEIVPIGGPALPFRGTWTPLEDGRVRQFFEQSNDGGATWTPWFEGFYARTATGG